VPNFMLIGARVCEPRRVKVEGLPSETYMAYNTLHCTSVHACEKTQVRASRPKNIPTLVTVEPLDRISQSIGAYINQFSIAGVLWTTVPNLISE